MSKKLEPVLTIKKNELPQGWELATISDLVGEYGVFVDGDWVESKDQDPEGDVRLIQLADIGDGGYRDKSARFLTSKKAKALRCTFLEKGDVLIARMPDPLGRACIFPGDKKRAVTVVDVAVVRAGQYDFNHRWLMYFLNAPAFRSAVSALQSGSTRKRISRKNLSSISLPVPPINQQKRIVAEIEKQFSRLDEAVANLKRVKANLKRYKAAVLKAAVEGKLTEEWRKQHPDVEPADKLLERILEERREKWQGRGKYKEPVAPDTTGLPELPVGWVWSSIGQAFEVCIGATPSRGKNEYWNGDVPWVSSGEVAFCRIRSTRETITNLGLDNTSTTLHPPGTVLLGMIGEGKTRGQTAILDIEACNNQNSAAIRVSDTEVIPAYIYSFLENEYESTRKRGSGGNQPALNKSRVSLIPFPLPPVTEQDKIVAEVECRLSIVADADAQVDANLRRADRLRQSILKEAFSGQLVSFDPNDEPANVLLENSYS